MSKEDILLAVGIGIAGLAAWKFGLFDPLISAVQGGGATAPPTPEAAAQMPTPTPTPTYTYPDVIPYTVPAQTVPVPVTISIPVTTPHLSRTDKNSDNFAAAVEAQIRKNCPAGSIGPDSSTCRANVRHYFPDYASAYSNSSSSDLRSKIIQSVGSATNCCCTPTSMPCQYKAHIGSGLFPVMQ